MFLQYAIGAVSFLLRRGRQSSHVNYPLKISRFYRNSDSLAVRCEFGGVHTLQRGDAVGNSPCCVAYNLYSNTYIGVS